MIKLFSKFLKRPNNNDDIDKKVLEEAPSTYSSKIENNKSKDEILLDFINENGEDIYKEFLELVNSSEYRYKIGNAFKYIKPIIINNYIELYGIKDFTDDILDEVLPKSYLYERYRDDVVNGYNFALNIDFEISTIVADSIKFLIDESIKNNHILTALLARKVYIKKYCDIYLVGEMSSEYKEKIYKNLLILIPLYTEDKWLEASPNDFKDFFSNLINYFRKIHVILEEDILLKIISSDNKISNILKENEALRESFEKLTIKTSVEKDVEDEKLEALATVLDTLETIVDSIEKRNDTNNIVIKEDLKAKEPSIKKPDIKQISISEFMKKSTNIEICVRDFALDHYIYKRTVFSNSKIYEYIKDELIEICNKNQKLIGIVSEEEIKEAFINSKVALKYSNRDSLIELYFKGLKCIDKFYEEGNIDAYKPYDKVRIKKLHNLSNKDELYTYPDVVRLFGRWYLDEKLKNDNKINNSVLVKIIHLLTSTPFFDHIEYFESSFDLYTNILSKQLNKVLKEELPIPFLIKLLENNKNLKKLIAQSKKFKDGYEKSLCFADMYEGFDISSAYEEKDNGQIKNKSANNEEENKIKEDVKPKALVGEKELNENVEAKKNEPVEAKEQIEVKKPVETKLEVKPKAPTRKHSEGKTLEKVNDQSIIDSTPNVKNEPINDENTKIIVKPRPVVKKKKVEVPIEDNHNSNKNEKYDESFIKFLTMLGNTNTNNKKSNFEGFLNSLIDDDVKI